MGICASCASCAGSFTPPVPDKTNPRGIVVVTPAANEPGPENENTLSGEITEREWVQNLSVGEIPMYIVLGNQNSDQLWSLSPETMFNLYPKFKMRVRSLAYKYYGKVLLDGNGIHIYFAKYRNGIQFVCDLETFINTTSNLPPPYNSNAHSSFSVSYGIAVGEIEHFNQKEYYGINVLSAVAQYAHCKSNSGNSGSISFCANTSFVYIDDTILHDLKLGLPRQQRGGVRTRARGTKFESWTFNPIATLIKNECSIPPLNNYCKYQLYNMHNTSRSGSAQFTIQSGYRN